MDENLLKGAFLMDEAKAFWRAKSHDEALDCLQKALVYFMKGKDHHNTAACLLNMSSIQFAKGDLEASNETMKLALAIATKYRYDDIANAINKNLDVQLEAMGVSYQPPKKNLLQKIFKK
jgi:tetratricopeptide (TPR) repeat protein